MHLLRPRSILVLSLSLLTALTMRAQSQDPALPPQTPDSTAATLDPRLPTLFIVGDSTAHLDPDRGWGSHLAHYFDTSRINVSNRAIAARSSRSYLDEGSWDNVLPLIKSGDFVLLQWGHNDASNLTDPKPWHGTGTLRGLGNETKEILQLSGPTAGKLETIHTFGWYMRRYIADIRAKGATPILLTLTIRDIWKPDARGIPRIERDMGYDTDIKKLGAIERVAVADMANIEADHLESIGKVAAKELFPADDTHTSQLGAEMNAQAVVVALEKIQSPLVPYLTKPVLGVGK